MSDAYIEYARSLEEAQFLPPAALRRYQEKLLAPLIRHAATIPFYRGRLGPLLRHDGGIDFARWGEVPVLTRSEAADNAAALRAADRPAFAGPAIAAATSGSTGKAFQTWQSTLSLVAAASLMMDFYHWHGINPDRCIADIRMDRTGSAAYPAGATVEGWGPAARALGYRKGRYALLDVGTPVAEQLEWLGRLKPDYLLTYPSNLEALAEQAAGEAGPPLRLARILTVGEVVTQRCRDLAGRVFSAPVIDSYGTTEAGHVASQCPMAQHYHVRAEALHLEILGDGGRPCAPGETGRIILTPFYNYTMPLIRYDIGDLGVPGAGPCPCGRGLPVLESILGRTRNVFTFPDGSRRFPTTQIEELARFVPLRKFQVVQTAPDAIELRYVPRGAGGPVDLAGLTAYFRARMHPALRVTAVAMDEIPRSAGGKYEDHVSLVRGRSAPA